MEHDEVEKRLRVITPTGHVGEITVTRREIKLIESGKLNTVEVLGTDGLSRPYHINELTVYTEPEEDLSEWEWGIIRHEYEVYAEYGGDDPLMPYFEWLEKEKGYTVKEIT